MYARIARSTFSVSVAVSSVGLSGASKISSEPVGSPALKVLSASAESASVEVAASEAVAAGSPVTADVLLGA